jgi:hypothetical protein
MFGAQVGGSCRAAAMEEAGALGVSPVVDYQRFNLDSLEHRCDVVFDTAGTLSLKESRALLRGAGVALDINPKAGKMFANAPDSARIDARRDACAIRPSRARRASVSPLPFTCSRPNW